MEEDIYNAPILPSEWEYLLSDHRLGTTVSNECDLQETFPG